ncbi:MAG: YkuS family protein [Clostridia bacterium]|nr:YkuS family protein [Clostridia bacterium]
MGKRIGIQKELNELGEALTVNGFEVTQIFDRDEKLDAVIYFDDENNPFSKDSLKFLDSNESLVRINASEKNIDEIMEILNNLK